MRKELAVAEIQRAEQMYARYAEELDRLQSEKAQEWTFPFDDALGQPAERLADMLSVAANLLEEEEAPEPKSVIKPRLPKPRTTVKAQDPFEDEYDGTVRLFERSTARFTPGSNAAYFAAHRANLQKFRRLLDEVTAKAKAAP